MSVASRIQEIETHIGDIYDTLEVGGTDLTDLNKNIVNINSSLKDRYKYFLNNGVEVIWNNWEKVIGEGTEFTLENTIQAPMKINLKGNTYQKSTTGKNLIPFTNQDFTLNNVRYYVENGSLYLNGTSTGETSSLNANFKNNFNFTLPKGTYTISHKTGIIACFLYKYDDNTSILTLGTNTTSQTFTLSEETQVFLGFYVYQKTFANINAEVMIETGSQATSYEPYTNGASPNPDYPQDIHVVSGDNTIEVVGKNLLNPNYREATNTNSKFYVSNGYLLKANTTYTMSYKGANPLLGIYINEYGTNTRLAVAYSKYFLSYTPTKDVMAWFDFYATDIDNTISNFQLEVGSATPYEPYQKESFPINLGVENLFDGATWVTKGNNSNYYSYSNGTLSINSLDTRSWDSFQDSEKVFLPNGTYILSGTGNAQLRVYTNSSTIISTNQFEVTEGYVYLKFVSNSVMTCQPQIERGTKANSFSPYGQTPIELCKIGNYQDSIVKDNGKWYLHKEIGKHIITDSDISLISSYWYSTHGQYGAGIPKTNLGLPDTTTNRKSLCNVSNKIDEQTNIADNTYIFNANAKYVFFFGSSFDTKEHANEKLVGAEVYFNLDTPTTTEITDTTLLSQLEALKKAESYSGQTNISQVNNDMPFKLEVTALKNI